MFSLHLSFSVSDSGSSQGLSQPSTQTTQYLRADTPNNATPVTSKTTTTPCPLPLTSDKRLSQTSQPSAVTICTALPWFQMSENPSLPIRAAPTAPGCFAPYGLQTSMLNCSKFHTSECILSRPVHTKCAFLYKLENWKRMIKLAKLESEGWNK